MTDDELRRAAHFKVVGRAGRFYWELINPNGTPTARSIDTFATEGEAFVNAELARDLISGHRPRADYAVGQV